MIQVARHVVHIKWVEISKKVKRYIIALFIGSSPMQAAPVQTVPFYPTIGWANCKSHPKDCNKPIEYKSNKKAKNYSEESNKKKKIQDILKLKNKNKKK